MIWESQILPGRCKPKDMFPTILRFKSCPELHVKNLANINDMFGPTEGSLISATWRCQGSVQRLSTLLRSSGLQGPVELLKASISGVEGNHSWHVQKLICKPPQDWVYHKESYWYRQNATKTGVICFSLETHLQSEKLTHQVDQSLLVDWSLQIDVEGDEDQWTQWSPAKQYEIQAKRTVLEIQESRVFSLCLLLRSIDPF